MDGRNSWLRNHYEKDKIHHLIVNEVPGNGHEIKYRGYQKGIRRRILDLGCGSGYLAFPMAKNNPDSEVIGLDIVSDTLEVNRSGVNKEGIKNLSFVSYDGIDFPFEDQSFDLVVTRYALHHFPDIEHSIGEMSRVLKEGGTLFISDPCPNECDTERFVDDYMRIRRDLSMTTCG